MKKVRWGQIFRGFFFSVIMSTGSLFAANHDEGMQPAEGLFLPDGNAEAGKKTFAELKCTACHWVQNELSLAAPVAEKAGPVLGAKQAGYATGWLASSIVSPSHTIALNSDGTAEDSELSRMGDYTDTMTVRQLMDVVAYLQSLGNEGAPESE